MAKQGRKLRNRSPTQTVSEVNGSRMKNKAESPSFDDPELLAPSIPLGSANRATSGMISARMESLDNVHSPYFLHSADHPGLSIVSHILDGSNYNNCMVNAWVMNVVNREIYESILYYEDAAEMWNDLFLRFRMSNLPRKYQLEQAIYILKQGSLDLSTYYTKKKTLWEQLANTKSHSAKKCNCDTVKELLDDAETSKSIQFLMGLNDNFANIRGQILNNRPCPGMPEIYNILD
ncbi:uncharacterized protein LOC112084603 [Eutrema salsugineum]|uniref:uncharacterized protein LOC112084603 n=1 Tax=Eutrema salsugineum TaxID=72664 RepID=UPI000CED3724|nr:uncharacterized protein LOC112084603 [Eutrema salsugineum]